ncbi:MAG: hypothetical protein QS721_00215 [Candidatus Endonucleobacter sp. (ex Gigantidas childressi)]|nr:hypothetical protein [Candidatus Endonucleobacter sp. (ex Gigantidas childressi)]
MSPTRAFNRSGYIPVTFEVATLLSVLSDCSRLKSLSFYGLAHLLPSSNSKSFGYIPVAFQSVTLLAALAHPYHLRLMGLRLLAA